MSDQALLDAAGVGRRYGQRQAVEAVNLRVRRGEIHGLLGLNGAGKSTTLRMLCGTLAPTRGQIRLAGLDLLEHPIEAKRQLGYLPEIPPLHPDTCVDEYLRYATLVRRLPRGQRSAAVDRALQLCDLGAVRRRLIRNLSKGFQQRVGIAQAIVHQPALIILDEPTAGLDPRQVSAIRDLIRALRQEHAVLFSSHILPEVQSLCDRVTILHQGRQVYQGKPQGDANRNRVRVRFRSPPPLNALAGIPGVEHVESLEEQGVLLSLSLDTAMDVLLRQSLDNGWGLEELRPERPTLEQIFLDLTTGEELA
ncbi:MAG: ABC transporter ATP-binding protein [Ectothiorhodospiraceae bacterium]|nr:ABC transporter ATP-binding protein [Ectothiorhodospiraceae bacterium]MCH8505756.1 ABC transporter ATP-binding protein [Ectothiorhodospiraceae bacterium]